MGLIRYRCPTTSHEIATAIETGSDTLLRMKAMNLKIWVWCPHCTPGHQILASDAVLPETSVRLEPSARPQTMVRRVEPPRPATTVARARV